MGWGKIECVKIRSERIIVPAEAATAAATCDSFFLFSKFTFYGYLLAVQHLSSHFIVELSSVKLPCFLALCVFCGLLSVVCERDSEEDPSRVEERLNEREIERPHHH